MTTEVDDYFLNGCGRCALVGTPDCKVHNWDEELLRLRNILRSTALTEELKWGSPCYTLNGINLVMIAALKKNAVLSFFKGALLQDPKGLLQKPGEHSQSARYFKFTTVDQIEAYEAEIREFIQQAITAENAGLKVSFKQSPEPIPDELAAALENDPKLEAAWQGLTPGRKRGYILHIAGAKRSSTRKNRIAKWTPQILRGKGMHDRD